MTTALFSRADATASMRPTPRWGPVQWIAVAGVPIVVWWVWMMVAWLADGPHQITEFRDSSSANWWVCRVYEGLGIAVALTVGTIVVRGCIKAHRVFTFDVLFVLAGLTIFPADMGPNVFVPSFIASSNFVNLNSPLGHAPFMVNPEIGSYPDPVLFSIPVEAFGLLGGAMIAGRFVSWCRARWPGISTPRLIGLLLLFALVLDLTFELPLIALGGWTYTSPPAVSIPLGGGYRYAFHELFVGAAFFGMGALVRVFKNDRGETLLERGLGHLAPGRRAAVLFMALFAVFQVGTWGPGTVPLWTYGPYQTEWPKLPTWIVNDICDTHDVQGTRYGPCPGSPGFRMPGRTTFADDPARSTS